MLEEEKDYLNRDSFYTGVSEGVIGFDRILKMLHVVNDELVVEEKLIGRLTTTAIGESGFGYDPIFIPDGFEITTAQMDPALKDQISHRGMAFRALVPKVFSAL